MASQKRIMKVFIIIILAVFLLSSGLVSVMYFVDMNKKVPAQGLSGEVVSGDVAVQESLPSEAMSGTNQ